MARLERTEETCPPVTQEDEDRGIGPCLPGIQEVTLVQPLRVGDDGVWVVAAVRSPDIEVDLVPGQILRNGASVTASVQTGEADPRPERSLWVGSGRIGTASILPGRIRLPRARASRCGSAPTPRRARRVGHRCTATSWCRQPPGSSWVATTSQIP